MAGSVSEVGGRRGGRQPDRLILRAGEGGFTMHETPVFLWAAKE